MGGTDISHQKLYYHVRTTEEKDGYLNCNLKKFKGHLIWKAFKRVQILTSAKIKI